MLEQRPPNTSAGRLLIQTLTRSRDGRNSGRFSGLTLVCLLWLATVSCGAGQADYQPGHCYFGRSNYVEYIAGDMPVIFSVPHGGEVSPAEIPNRNCAGLSADCATISDANTEELALAVNEVFRSYFGHSPYIVICRLKRTKLDCNREIEEAAAGHPHAQQAWREYHGFIDSASSAVVARTGRGLYIDLHGQSHPLKRVELGYLLTAEQLTNTDAVLDQPAYAAQSSIRTLASQVPISFSELLRGSNSFGGLLLSKGYPSLPDPVMRSPWGGGSSKATAGDLALYFGGGYSTRRHSTVGQGGPIDSLQLEANLEGVRDTATNRTHFALALAQTLDCFFATQYRLDLKAGASLPASTAKPAELPNDAGVRPLQPPPPRKPL
jgi:hypothetical protein